MDPDEALRRAREACQMILSGHDERGRVVDLCDAFRDLDEWMSRGGFAPTAWTKGN